MVTLTDKETQLMKTVLDNVEGGATAIVGMVDWDVVQEKALYKDVKNTKIMFRRLLIKIGEATESSTPKGPKTAAGSKPVGVTKTKAPSKGGRGRKAKVTTNAMDSNEGAGEGPVDASVGVIVEEEGLDEDIPAKFESSSDDDPMVKDELE
ncbi:MAG: hypothetical protein Q9195_008929 [Heterodermia aff. obscurata]